MAELADALDLGSSPERGRGSNPRSRTSLENKDLRLKSRESFFFAPPKI